MSQVAPFFVDDATASKADQLSTSGAEGLLKNVTISDVSDLDYKVNSTEFEKFYISMQIIVALSKQHRHKLREAMHLRNLDIVKKIYGTEKIHYFLIECLLDVYLSEKYPTTSDAVKLERRSRAEILSEIGCLRLANFMNFGLNYFRNTTYINYLDVGCALVGLGVVIPDNQSLARSLGLSSTAYARDQIDRSLNNDAWQRACLKYNVVSFHCSNARLG